jgi:hypothetical protein
VHLVLDIFQGIGIALAVGIRPFLPALAVGALAAGAVQIDFKGTDFSFLQSAPFLLAVLAATVLVALIDRRLTNKPTAEPRPATGTIAGARPLALAIAAVGLAIGAVLFAGALAQDRYSWWPGLIAGVLCAAVGFAATRPLLARVGGRLDRESASALPLFAEGSAVLVAVVSVVAPPAGIVALLLFGWLLFAGRRREQKKYAGLRILR